MHHHGHRRARPALPATEAIVMALKVSRDINPFTTNINPHPAQNRASSSVSDANRLPGSVQQAIVGKMPFSHASGIHHGGNAGDCRSSTRSRGGPEDWV